jgi:hypothetical protein
MALAFVRRTFFVMCVLGVAGCGSQSNPVAPSVASLAGNWFGSLDPGAVPLQFTLAQSKDALSGTWTMNGGAGTLSGTVFGSTMSIVLSWSAPTANCPITLSANVDATATQMTGGVSSPDCGGYSGNGGFRASRR